MTTEIAVLNRLGVALAADSAVTISGGGTTKVFESADKLFELSCVHPIALMINGNLDCFGFPWELLVKDFRDSHGDRPNKTITNWINDFISFVESRISIDKQVTLNYGKQIAIAELNLLKNNVSESLWPVLSRARRTRPQDVMWPVMADAISTRRSELAEEEVAENLRMISDDELYSKYFEILSPIIEEQLRPYTPPTEIKESIFPLIFDAFRALIPSTFSSGLIIAGYGHEAEYPSVLSVDIHGYIAGRLKRSPVQDKAHIEHPEFGYAVSFAQTDVIERLLGGIDPRFVDLTTEFLLDIADKLSPSIVNIYAPRASKKRRAEEERKIKDILSGIAEKYQAETAPGVSKVFREEFERMIALMPKLELIELAEALISITAIERKATVDEGTVGGPIDVAFITRHEGFVWIKRKYYFRPDLNPRYFWRKYGRTTIGGRELS
jgi:hypothetical protein